MGKAHWNHRESRVSPGKDSSKPGSGDACSLKRSRSGAKCWYVPLPARREVVCLHTDTMQTGRMEAVTKQGERRQSDLASVRTLTKWLPIAREQYTVTAQWYRSWGITQHVLQRSPHRTTPLLETVALQHSMSKEAGEVVGYPKRMKTFCFQPL